MEKPTIKHLGYGDLLMTGAFHDFVMFAFGSPELRKAFEDDTGLRLDNKPRSGIEAMIDAATGFKPAESDGAVMTAFIEWLIREHWGEEGAAVPA